jgi:hypothetical protein
MASIGDVAVTVGADVEPLKRGLKDGSRRIDGFKKDLQKAGKEAIKYNAALSLVATTGLALITKETAEAAKETKNLAFLANASVEEFQKMTFAAKSVGIEQDKLSDIFKDFNDRIGDFIATGGGPMLDFFEQIAPKVGVTADEFRNLSGPQALQLYYDSLERANLAQEDMTFFLEAMASDTTALIPLLRDGGKGFKELGDEAERFNVILSEQDIKELQKLDTTFVKIGAAVKGAATQVALLVSNEMGDLSKSVTGVITKLTEVIKGIRESRAETKKNLEVERQVVKELGIVRNNRGRIIKEGNASAIEINNLLKRQLELEELINGEFVKRAPKMAGTLKKQLEAHEKNKIRWKEEQEANTVRIDNLRKESEAAQRVFDIRNNTLEKEKEIAETPEVKEKPDFTAEDVGAKERAEAELEAIKNKYITEKQLLAMHKEEMAIIGDEFDATRFESEQQWMDIREQAEKEHLDKLTELRRKNMTEAERFSAMTWKNQVKNVSGALAQMTAGIAQHSKKAFEINKAAGITNAIINTYEGITKALAAYPPPISGIMAAAQAAAGFAQVNAIRSQTFNGGGSGRAPSLTGTAGTPVNDVSAQPVQQQAEPSRIVVEGLDPETILSGRAVTQLLQEAADNGAILTPA